MTLTPEQIKEAVELADGWEWVSDNRGGEVGHDSTGFLWYLRDDKERTLYLAALASQLISQIDAMEPKVYTSVCRGWTAIRDTDNKQDLVAKYGPNRDENSILACCQFLREKGK